MNTCVFALSIAVLFCAVSLTGCATSSSVRTGSFRYAPTDKEDVQVLAELPDNYEIVGIVEASAPRGHLRKPESATKVAMAELRKQAAALGAHAVVVEAISTDHVPDFSLGDDDDWGLIFNSERRHVQGKAIRILD